MVSGHTNRYPDLFVLSEQYKTKYISPKEFSSCNHVIRFSGPKFWRPCLFHFLTVGIQEGNLRGPKYCMLFSGVLQLSLIPTSWAQHQSVSLWSPSFSLLLPIQISFSTALSETKPSSWWRKSVYFLLNVTFSFKELFIYKMSISCLST